MNLELNSIILANQRKLQYCLFLYVVFSSTSCKHFCISANVQNVRHKFNTFFEYNIYPQKRCNQSIRGLGRLVDAQPTNAL